MGAQEGHHFDSKLLSIFCILSLYLSWSSSLMTFSFSFSWWATNFLLQLDTQWTQCWVVVDRERDSLLGLHTHYTHTHTKRREREREREAPLFPARREMHSCRLLLRHFLGRESAAYAICFFVHKAASGIICGLVSSSKDSG